MRTVVNLFGCFTFAAILAVMPTSRLVFIAGQLVPNDPFAVSVPIAFHSALDVSCAERLYFEATDIHWVCGRSQNEHMDGVAPSTPLSTEQSS